MFLRWKFSLGSPTRKQNLRIPRLNSRETSIFFHQWIRENHPQTRQSEAVGGERGTSGSSV